MTPSDNFRIKLLGAFDAYKHNPAIEVNGTSFNYEQLHQKARMVANCLATVSQRQYVGILGSRSYEVCAGICGIVLADSAWVPLNPKFPTKRLSAIVEEGLFDTLILCPEAVDVFAELAPDLRDVNIVWLGEPGALSALQADFSHLTYVRPASDKSLAPPIVDDERPAYLLFTSGTTGKPKKVMINDGNLSAYLKGFNQLCEISPGDRHSQFFELSFDVSVHDLFMTWCHGACLVIVPESALLAPAKFIKNSGITVWFSVPATAGLMQKFGMLKPGSYPDLRLSMFIGEALPADVVPLWQACAPNSQVWNVYGPTEATIACLYYDCAKLSDYQYDVTPIGIPFGETRCEITETGELLVSGPQVASGYLGDPEKSQQVFTEDSTGTRCYHTGDLVAISDESFYEYHGRIDDQVQVRGFRVELGEVESCIAKVVGHSLVCVVLNKRQQLQAFVESASDRELQKRIFEACKSLLPDYMNPQKVTFTQKLPLNSNGKIDRNALRRADGLDQIL